VVPVEIQTDTRFGLVAHWVVLDTTKAEAGLVGLPPSTFALGNPRDDGGMASGPNRQRRTLYASAPIVADVRPPHDVQLSIGIASMDSHSAPNVAASISIGNELRFLKVTPAAHILGVFASVPPATAGLLCAMPHLHVGALVLVLATAFACPIGGG